MFPNFYCLQTSPYEKNPKKPQTIKNYNLRNCEESCIDRSCSEMFHKKVVLKILQNSQENNCVGVSLLIKLQLY